MSTVIRWNPVREMAAMQSAMDRMFEGALHNNGTINNSSALPLDVYENDNAFTVVADLPGAAPDDIDIRIHENVLTIEAELLRAEPEENSRVLVNERTAGKFTRRINLRSDVDADNVDANYVNGVLTLTLPKVAAAQPRTIRVNGTVNG